MAGRVYETMFELGARINSSFGNAFRNAQNQLRATGGQAEEANTRFSKLGMGLGAAAAGIGAAALAAGGLAVSVSDDLKRSLNNIQAAAGVANEQMGGMRDTMLAVYNNNLGESFEDIGNAMTAVSQQTGLAGAALQAATEDGLMLRDTLGMEVNESIRTVDMMMKKFGVSSDEAFNLIAQGAQAGLDKNGNLLDSINEYSVHFEQLGLNSEEMMNMMANGAAAGVYDIDKLGDAMKEFGIRSKDGSKLSAEGFEAMGLNAAEMSKAFAAGGDTAKEAFSKTTKALFAMENPLEKEAAGVALFGTMWEDVGAKGMEALVNTQGEINKTTDALGKINEVKYDSFGKAIQGIKRNLETEILIPMGESVMPIMNDFANWIIANMPTIKNEIEFAMKVAGEAASGLGAAITETKDFFVEHWNIVAPIIAGIGAGAITFGTITLATKAWTAAVELSTKAQAALNLVMNLSPMAKVALLIGALVAAGVLLYQNWDTIKLKAGQAWAAIKNAAVSAINTVIDKINWLITMINKIPGVNAPLISRMELQKTESTQGGVPVGHNAAGTDNWRGGLTWVGELGPELVDLPKGAQVYDHNESMEMAGRFGNTQELNTQPKMQRKSLAGLGSSLSVSRDSSSITLTFAPQIRVDGNADEVVVTKVMKMSFDEFKRFMKQYENDKHRLQFSPS